jgi:hypothetical protein
MKSRQYLLLSVLILSSTVQAFAYYHPDEGRWINRDSEEEDGGIMLYGFCLNNSINSIDYLGQAGIPTFDQIAMGEAPPCCLTEDERQQWYERKAQASKLAGDLSMEALSFYIPLERFVSIGMKLGSAVIAKISSIRKVCLCGKEIQEVTALAKRVFSIDSTQMGRKLAKHCKDFGLDPSNVKDREFVTNLIKKIGETPEKVYSGTFAGQGAAGYRGTVEFRVIGNDVVMTTPEGRFISILKDGINNPSVKEAVKKSLEKTCQ